MAARDRYLDYLRGIAIVWVVVVHVFYLKAFVPAGSTGAALKAVILFEMPLLFFVSGAALYHSHRRAPAIGPFLWRRGLRLLLPYALLAVVCAGLFYRKGLLAGGELTAEQVVSWLALRPWPVEPVYVGAYTWFVRVMLAVTVAHVGLVRAFQSDRYRAPVAALLVAGVVALSLVGRPLAEFHAVPLEQLPQYTVFYGAFAYLGYYYAGGRLPRRPLALGLALVAAVGLLVALASRGLVSGDLQLDKFPPNVGYGLFGLAGVALWLLLRPGIVAVAEGVRPVGAALRFFGTHSYSVYLYHGFGFWATDYALPYLHVSDRLQGAPYPAWMGVYFAFALGFAALIAGAVDALPGFIRGVSALFPPRLAAPGAEGARAGPESA